VVKGYRAIRDMYAARFGGTSGALGQLTMEILDFRPLGPDYALIVGRYHLKPAKPGPEASGVFTLVFHKSAAGWRIISDHTG
jgi:ketosteroid isomerase-like protein